MDVKEYWLSREAKGENGYGGYARASEDRSIFLGDLVLEFSSSDKKDTILEVGCNTARNLNHLQGRGFSHLYGCDINPKAISAALSYFPNLNASLLESSAEDYFKEERAYDIIFTMAVLEHIPEGLAVFSGLAKSFKTVLIIIEDESTVSPRHFPRNYGEEFTRLGLDEILNKPVPIKNFESFRARVFSHA